MKSLKERGLLSVRGMNDLCKDSAKIYQIISDLSRNILQKYGYNFCQPNLLEDVNLFNRSLGTTSDVVTKEMFSQTDKSGNNLVLRPEATASVVRMVIEKNLIHDLPQRLYYNGPMFRYERPQKGRYRQFHQIGIENVGSNYFMNDAEVAFLGHKILQAINGAFYEKDQDKFKKIDYIIKVNSLGTNEERNKFSLEFSKYLLDPKIYNELSEISKKRLELKAPLRILDSKEKMDIEICKNGPKLFDFLGNESLKNFDDIILSQHEALGDTLDMNEIVHDYNLVRGLDYYNNFCFEFVPKSIASKSQSALIAGGRYDSLGSTIVGKKFTLPACGFAMGVERIIDYIYDNSQENQKNVIESINSKEKVGIIIIKEPISPEKFPEKNFIKIVEILIKTWELETNNDKGFDFEILYENHKNLPKRLDWLENSRGCHKAIIFGLTELEENHMKVKDLVKRTEKIINLQQFGDNLH